MIREYAAYRRDAEVYLAAERAGTDAPPGPATGGEGPSPSPPDGWAAPSPRSARPAAIVRTARAATRGRRGPPSQVRRLVAAEGKARAGGDWHEAALREVAEETGLRCELGQELPSARYRDRKGRDEACALLPHEPGRRQLRADDEVDELRWLSPTEADAMLGYEHDRALIAELGRT